ncbi:hypothetical protein [Caldisericum sp.]|uniref:hypothetical protein n=1 Tax=Caldisericum sp. TaxID=2499687 RepID=UPI003D09B8D8
MFSYKIAFFSFYSKINDLIIKYLKVLIPEICVITQEQIENNSFLDIQSNKKYVLCLYYNINNFAFSEKLNFINVFVEYTENAAENDAENVSKSVYKLCQKISKKDIKDKFDYILSITSTDEQYLLEKIKQVLTESKFWIFIKKKYQKNNGKIIVREFHPTFHSIQQFKKRVEILDNLINSSEIDDEFIIKRISSYKKYLENNNKDFIDCFKKVFLSSNKLNNLNKKYKWRRKKYDKNTEFFTDNLFVFVVLHDTILTAELVPTTELKYINKMTSSVKRISFSHLTKPKVINKKIYI